MANLMEQLPSLLGTVIGASLLVFTTEKFLSSQGIEPVHKKAMSLLDTVVV
jgi:hypothetical protein